MYARVTKPFLFMRRGGRTRLTQDYPLPPPGGKLFCSNSGTFNRLRFQLIAYNSQAIRINQFPKFTPAIVHALAVPLGVGNLIFKESKIPTNSPSKPRREGGITLIGAYGLTIDDDFAYKTDTS